MAAKLRGIKEAIAKTSQIVDEITAVKIVRALKSATYIIRLESATMIPIATSTLINSQFESIEVNGTRVTGKVGYSANYAIYVHNAPGRLLGKKIPRSGKLKGLGNVWDKSGEPKFLAKAGEKTKSLVDKAVKEEMRL